MNISHGFVRSFLVLCVSLLFGVARAFSLPVKCIDQGPSAAHNCKPKPVLYRGRGAVGLFRGRPVTVRPRPAGLLPGAGTIAHPLPKALGYDLKITGVNSTPYTVELTPVEVSYSFTISILGQTGPTPVPPDIFICSAFAYANLPCKKIASPQVGQTYTGMVLATAPWAGLTSQMHIVALDSVLLGELYNYQVVADANSPISTAATYRLYFDSFTLKDTRSNNTDTVWLNLQGQVSATPPDASAADDACKRVGFQWCDFGYKIGNAHNSGIHAVKVPQYVGDFALTPEKEDSLKVLYYLYNYGTSSAQEIGDGIANAFSKAGEAILGAFGAAEGSSATVSYAQELDGILESYHNAATASCDGPVVLDVAIFENKSYDGSNVNTLDNFTRSTGVFTDSPDTVYRYKDGDYVCDRRGSAYLVKFSVHRTSWRGWYEYP